MRASTYLRALETALHGAGLPYGYAVTVWSTGAVLIGEQGTPSVGRVFLFAAGAASAYGALRFLTQATEGEAGTQLTRSPHLIRAGAIHVAAIGLAIGGAALIARIDSVLAWPLATFAATLLYLGVSSVEKALLDQEQDPSGPGKP
jgi:hypothetical protein